MDSTVQLKVVIKNVWHSKSVIKTFMYKTKNIILIKYLIICYTAVDRWVVSVGTSRSDPAYWDYHCCTNRQTHRHPVMYQLSHIRTCVYAFDNEHKTVDGWIDKVGTIETFLTVANVTVLPGLQKNVTCCFVSCGTASNVHSTNTVFTAPNTTIHQNAVPKVSQKNVVFNQFQRPVCHTWHCKG